MKTYKNQTYCGVWHFSDIAVDVPAIISRELWEAVQKGLEDNKAMASRNKKAQYRRID